MSPIIKTNKGYKIQNVKGFSPTYPRALSRLRAIKISQRRK